MANTPKKDKKQSSAEKYEKQSKKRHIENSARKTAIKTTIKKVLAAINAKDVPQAKELFKDLQAKFARAKSKDVMHANTASRKLSRIAQKINQVEQKA